ncbi:hypothetical protein OIU77_020393, partial [Salix suchowensis]
MGVISPNDIRTDLGSASAEFDFKPHLNDISDEHIHCQLRMTLGTESYGCGLPTEM